MIEVKSRYKNVIFPTYVFELDLKEYDKDFYKEIISDHMVTRTEPLTLSNTDLHKDEKMKEWIERNSSTREDGKSFTIKIGG